MPRYFISIYTDGPSTRWNVIDRRTQEWVRRFPTEAAAQEYADKLNGETIDQDASASLTAAAPELLRVARMALRVFERDFPNGQGVIDIRAAIEKATSSVSSPERSA